MNSTLPPEPPVSNDIISILQRHRGGGVLRELGEKLAEVVAAVNLTGRRGVVTLKLIVGPAARGKAIVLMDTLSEDAPKTDAQPSIWFSTGSGLLLKDDPQQMEFKPTILPAAQAQA